MYATEKNVEVLLQIFKALEQRDERRFRELVDPEFESHWPPSLPYGGTVRAFEPRVDGYTWQDTWIPLQPTEAERQMDPRVVSASKDTVVVVYRQRGISPAGERFDGEVVGLYQFRSEKLTRAQMFYFDSAAVASFLARAMTPEQRFEARSAFDRFKTLPDDRREVLGRAYEDLRRLPPVEQRQKLNSEEFTALLSSGERDLLNKLLALKLSYGEDDHIGRAAVRQH